MLKVSPRQAKNSALVVLMLAQLLVVAAGFPNKAVAQSSATSALPESDQRRLRYYLLQGQQAVAAQRLLWPKDDNAYQWFQQALALDSQHPQAHQGMRQIGQAYVALAQEAYIEGDRAKAELMLERAQQVSVSPAEAAAIKQRYPAPKAAKNEFTLSPHDLSQQNTQVKAQLTELALRAKKLSSRLLIVARSDREGRWIYKHMRESVAGYRLRGNIQLGSVPKIVLIDMTLSAAADG
ncbi:hypothetical protein [Dasania marina]|uniref:hypothetical protein n=1 Tax=Dasania marina TaxID=471499 RepID=UPI0003790F67|nr:hypothetical protein [Dasania marina]